MNVDELRYFVEAAKEQNLSRAARTLGITQSTLTHAVRRLEGQFGCTLFEKKGKAVFVTHQGKLLAQKAQEVIATIQVLKNEMNGPNTPLLGRFRVGAAPGVAARVLTRAWNRMRCQDGATLELTSMRSAQILEQVASKKLEFGLCFNPQPYPDLRALALAKSDGLVMVRSGHPILQQPKKMRAVLLADYPMATPKHLPGTEACSGHPIFSKIGQPVGARYYFDNYDIAFEILQSSDAWAILPEAILREEKRKLVPVDLESRDSVILTLVSSEGEGSSQVPEKLVGAIRDAALKLGWETI